jgi:hypothetical protein
MDEDSAGARAPMDLVTAGLLVFFLAQIGIVAALLILPMLYA